MNCNKCGEPHAYELDCHLHFMKEMKDALRRINWQLGLIIAQIPKDRRCEVYTDWLTKGKVTKKERCTLKKGHEGECDMEVIFEKDH